jgi:23S rRNA (pseudouridine1915-N3)-methyltransferase
LKIWLYYIGKARDVAANSMAAEYVKRTTRFGHLEMREVKPGRIEFNKCHPGAQRVLLDPAGRMMTSNEFAGFISRAEMAGRDLLFLVGGADGLPDEWRSPGDTLLSLSPMTLPHELARAVLAEQIYRAFTILRGHPYPR